MDVKKNKFVIAYNSPSRYNTCLMSSLFIGIKQENLDISVHQMFSLFFEHVHPKNLGEMMVYDAQAITDYTSENEIAQGVSKFLHALVEIIGITIKLWTATEAFDINVKKRNKLADDRFIRYFKGTQVAIIGNPNNSNVVEIILYGNHFHLIYGYNDSLAQMEPYSHCCKKIIDKLNGHSTEYSANLDKVVMQFREDLFKQVSTANTSKTSADEIIIATIVEDIVKSPTIVEKDEFNAKDKMIRIGTNNFGADTYCLKSDLMRKISGNDFAKQLLANEILYDECKKIIRSRR
jgi:hypothetical protein